MRLRIPLTGTVLVEGSVHEAGDLVGDDKDPIRLININLGNVSWTMIDVDLENEVMIIEVEAGETVSEPVLDGEGKQKLEEDGSPIYHNRPATENEKQGFLQHAQEMIETRTKNELYQMSGAARLKRPFKGK